MAKSEIEKRNQDAEDYLDIFKSYLVNKVPLFGDELNLILNARSDIRKGRILKFFVKFREEMERVYGKPLDEDDITSEEFIDVMDAVMAKVQTTRSEIKLEYYRNILINQLLNKSANEILVKKIIQTVDELNELQLLLIHSIRNYKQKGEFPTLYDVIVFFGSNNFHIRISKGDELPANVESDQVMESGIFLYFVEELVSKNIVREIETEGYAEPRLRELKKEFESYIDRKRKNSGTKIVYVCSDYGNLICDFILVDPESI